MKTLVPLGALVITSIVLFVVVAQHTQMSNWESVTFSVEDTDAFDIQIEPQYPIDGSVDCYSLRYRCWYTVIIIVTYHCNGIWAKLVVRFWSYDTTAGKYLPFPEIDPSVCELMLSDHPVDPIGPLITPSDVALTYKTGTVGTPLPNYLEGESPEYEWADSTPLSYSLAYEMKFRVNPGYPPNSELRIFISMWGDPTIPLTP